MDREVRTINRVGTDDPLHQAVLAVEEEHELAAECAEWEFATIDDGLCDRGGVPPEPLADHK